MNTNQIVIGLGEVGMAIMRLIAKKYNVIGIDTFVNMESLKNMKNIEIMHVAIPYTDKFEEIVNNYKEIFKPDFIVIYSSVLPGTTEKFGEYAIHSPIEGRHPNLFESVSSFTRYISGPMANRLETFYKSLNLNVVCYSNSRITEVGKLLSTTRYGVNLMFADISNEICEKYNVKYENAVLDYINMYNNGYNYLENRFIQPKLTPPNGNIGGHCVINNAKILMNSTKNKIIELLANFNNKEGNNA